MNVTFNSVAGPIKAGPNCPARVMALLGMSAKSQLHIEIQKLDELSSMNEGPDIVSDLSIVRPDRPLWQEIVDRGFCAASLPIYTANRKDGRIHEREVLDIAIEQMDQGVRLLTIHPTATHELIELAKSRLVPWTSRGGGLVIRDMLQRERMDNLYVAILPDLVAHARKTGSVISLGATFRSSNIFDSLDEVQIREIQSQISLAEHIAAAGVGVIIESPGHAKPVDIQKCARLLAATGFPIMPLGPIPTDNAIGSDHVAAAIGATLMGMEGGAHILAAVTREEHTGGIPTSSSIVEAVRAARIAGHVIDMHLLGDVAADRRIATERAMHHTCVIGKQSAGCQRCASTCPLH